MNERVRLTGLVVLLGGGIALAVALSLRREGTPLPSSLAPAFQLAGTPVKAIDHLVTRVIPVSEVDERELGEILRVRFAAASRPGDSTELRYLNDLMHSLATGARKPFEYRVYLLPYDEPNAMALPGGVILVTRGLLPALGSEAELVAVLAHEQGHVERGHCLDAVKFELLAQRVGSRTLGSIADFAVSLLLSHSFSNTQEDDADEYAYAALLASPYDPRGAGRAFASLLRLQRAHGVRAAASRGADPMRDYFMSHPPLELREAKFRERAEAWWRLHPAEVRRLGEQNLRDRVSVPRREAGGLRRN